MLSFLKKFLILVKLIREVPCIPITPFSSTQLQFITKQRKLTGTKQLSTLQALLRWYCFCVCSYFVCFYNSMPSYALYRIIYISLQSQYRNILSSQSTSLRLVFMDTIPPPPNCPLPQLLTATSVLHLCSVFISQILWKCNHTVCQLLRRAFSTKHNFLTIQPNCLNTLILHYFIAEEYSI